MFLFFLSWGLNLFENKRIKQIAFGLRKKKKILAKKQRTQSPTKINIISQEHFIVLFMNGTFFFNFLNNFKFYKINPKQKRKSEVYCNPIIEYKKAPLFFKGKENHPPHTTQ